MSDDITIVVAPPKSVTISRNPATSRVITRSSAGSRTLSRAVTSSTTVQIAPKTSTLISVTPKPSIAIETNEEPASVPITTSAIRGPKGDSGSSAIATAGITISGQRIVTPQPDGTLIYLDATIASHISRPAWFATQAASAGGQIAVQYFGEISEPGWSWIPDAAIFLGQDGQLTQTPPVAPAFAFILALGYATSATSMYFAPQSPIALAP